MSDPWKDIRARHLYHRNTLEIGDYEVATEVMDQLLADADALLEVKSACDNIMTEALKHDADQVPEWLDKLLGTLSMTLAVLPLDLQKGE
jgi:hypothetical protein